jgi:AmmeMemoRadiSam system protein A
VENPTIAGAELTAEDRAALLALARGAVEACVRGRPAPDLPVAPAVRLRRGAFVTLEVGGALRGCLGRIAGDRALGEVIRSMAAAAAREDPRFPPVAADELEDLRVEISVLGELTPLPAAALGALVIGRDGLLVRRGRASGLLLPQVASEQGWRPEEFLAATCRKAGLAVDAWREPGTECFSFPADVFGETHGLEEETRR